MARLLLALIAAASALVVFVLPPKAAIVPASAERLMPVRGVIHVHTRRSDGTGTVEDVARAASRAGLSFVVLTDHGDAAREPDRPVYREGVLCIDAVEISTNQGHVVALGLPRSPYPLGGDADAVVEDVHRLGGWAVAAHPGSPRADLAWQDWQVPVDALEWVNGDSEWRDESVASLLRALVSYPFRAPEALATLLDRPAGVMKRWDELNAARSVVGLAAADAHARIGFSGLGEPYETQASLSWPSYASVFAAFSITVEGVALTGDAETDAAAVIRSIRDGSVYSTIDGLARGGQLTFTASTGGATVGQGGTIPWEGAAALHVEVSSPQSVRLELLRDGELVRREDGGSLEQVVTDPGAYRVEVSLAGPSGAPRLPWIVSNPIYLRAPAREAGLGPAGLATVRGRTYGPDRLAAARIESSDEASGATSLTEAEGAPELLFRYALGGRPSEGAYVAAVLTVDVPLGGENGVRFTGRADRPMRVSLQLRSPRPDGGARWLRSIYLDQTPRVITVSVAELRPVSEGALVEPGEVDSLLFVVDTVNTALGSSGRIWVQDLSILD